MKNVVRLFQILLGCLVAALGFNLFLIPGHLLTGGISGVSLIVYYITALPVGIQNLVYNLPILFLAYRIFGKRYFMDTIIGTVAFSIILDMTAFVIGWKVCANPILNAVFGGVLSGIGFGLVFRANANTGGLDVLGAIIKKYYSVDMGTAVAVLNFAIVMASAFMFELEEALLSIVGIYATAELTNRVAAGFNREKSIIIISPKAKEICGDIMSQVHRGVTYIDGRGGMSEARCDVLFTVVRLTQVAQVKEIVDQHDPLAFMIVSDTSEVSGRGFTIECESYEAACKRLSYPPPLIQAPEEQ
ncbi:YitT family protein [Anaerovibrio sp. JC8]|uniref:YitT family protein n=1 Tax=Anaerovibrio sp. JC8 TaxID=1240085 RepID=UPI000A0F4B97|nr:YitT family protein [Anaerovibrio sp. JC8]